MNTLAVNDEDTVIAIEGIGKVVNQVNEISTAIAAAIEEQGAATQEIARNEPAGDFESVARVCRVEG